MSQENNIIWILFNEENKPISGYFDEETAGLTLRSFKAMYRNNNLYIKKSTFTIIEDEEIKDEAGQ